MKIRSYNDSAEIEISGSEGLSQGPGRENYEVTLRHDGLDVSSKVYAFIPTSVSLDLFLRRLSQHWSGWSGMKTWESLEGEFRLIASHDGIGHVAFDATLASQMGWSANVTVTVAAGDLDGIAKEATRFFGDGTTA